MERNISPGKSSSGCLIPDWMPFALKQQGVKEVDGPKANPQILEYFEAAILTWAIDDSGRDNAWCACFVAWVMKQAEYEIANKAYRAKQWMNDWGEGKRIDGPIYGAIAVKSLTDGGHVGFVMGSIPGRPDLLAILGGNQADQVNVTAFARDDFEAFMVPKSYDPKACELLPYVDEYVLPSFLA